MTTTSKKGTMRQTMPLTAAWIDQCREKYGALHVDNCLRAAMSGQRNAFYAVEAGHIVGTPFDWNERAMYIVSMSVLTGAKFIAAIAVKGGGCELSGELAQEVVDGAH